MIQAGFEFEFGHDVNLDLIKQVIKQHYPKNKIYTITEDFDYERILSKNYFIFKTDTSVMVYDCRDKDTEIATPVFQGKTSILKNFKKIFNILKTLDVKTDESCSVHINVSFTEDEETVDINLGKLYLYINELQLLKIFKRTCNPYSKPCLSRNKCLTILKNTADKNIIKRIGKCLLLLELEHHQSIAIDKLKNGELNILEFRFIGGDYIDRYKDAENILNTVLDGMLFSIGKNKKTNITKVLKRFKLYNRINKDLEE